MQIILIIYLFTYLPYCNFLPFYLFRSYSQPINTYVVFLFKFYNHTYYLITFLIWLHLCPFLLKVFIFCFIWFHVSFYYICVLFNQKCSYFVLFDYVFHLITYVFFFTKGVHVLSKLVSCVILLHTCFCLL